MTWRSVGRPAPPPTRSLLPPLSPCRAARRLLSSPQPCSIAWAAPSDSATRCSACSWPSAAPTPRLGRPGAPAAAARRPGPGRCCSRRSRRPPSPSPSRGSAAAAARARPAAAGSPPRPAAAWRAAATPQPSACRCWCTRVQALTRERRPGSRSATAPGLTRQARCRARWVLGAGRWALGASALGAGRRRPSLGPAGSRALACRCLLNPAGRLHPLLPPCFPAGAC